MKDCLPAYPEFSALMAAYTLNYNNSNKVKKQYCIEEE